MRNLSGKDLHFPGMSVGESEKETARQSRSLSTSQKARIKSEKKSRGRDVLTGGRRGVKNLRTRLRVPRICDIHRERKEKDKLKRKKWHLSVRDLELTFVC